MRSVESPKFSLAFNELGSLALHAAERRPRTSDDLAEKKNDARRLAFYGDSITVGWGAGRVDRPNREHR